MPTVSFSRSPLKILSRINAERHLKPPGGVVPAHSDRVAPPRASGAGRNAHLQAAGPCFSSPRLQIPIARQFGHLLHKRARLRGFRSHSSIGDCSHERTDNRISGCLPEMRVRGTRGIPRRGSGSCTSDPNQHAATICPVPRLSLDRAVRRTRADSRVFSRVDALSIAVAGSRSTRIACQALYR
jgi:hypothetical protein